MNAPNIIAEAMAQHSQGNLVAADTLYQQALSTAPNNPELLHLYGMLKFQVGDHQKAIQFITQAIQLNPTAPNYHNNIGTVHESSGQVELAIAHYQQAIAIHPEYALAWFNLGTAYKNTHAIADAINALRHALALHPGNPDTLNNLGLALLEYGKSSEAESQFRAILQLLPDQAQARLNLGESLRGQKRFDEAIREYQYILDTAPNHAEALNNLGLVYLDLNQLDLAIHHFERAILVWPDFANAHNNLGVALKRLGKTRGAIKQYRHALEIMPNYAQALNNLGDALFTLGQLDEAIDCFVVSLKLAPQYWEAHNNYGNALKAQGKYADAIKCFEKALSFQPNYVDAHLNLSSTLLELGELEKAANHCRQAIAITPDKAEAHNNLGIALKKQGLFPEAQKCFEKALEMNPGYREAYGSLATLYRDQGNIEGAVQCYRDALKALPDNHILHSDLLFTQDLLAGTDTASLQAERKAWNVQHAQQLLRPHTFKNTRDSSRRLRIGYMSADFRAHSASYVFSAMLLRFNPDLFEVYAYSNTESEDSFTETIKQHVSAWRRIVELDDNAVSEIIREDAIDILVDLSGHSGGNRLLVFARKPAPIQITAWGYIGGTGMSAMDYFFADPVVVPPSEKIYFAESVYYLPSVIPGYFPVQFPDITESPAIASKQITFGAFNRLAKVSEATFHTWIEILQRIPHSRILFKTAELDNPVLKQRVLSHFSNAGIDTNRILIQGKSSWYEHMSAFRMADIALDSFPHNGGVTTLESLMMGLPMLTLRGKTVHGRVSASILTTLGLSDWVANSEAEYISLAIAKANDVNALADLRNNLRTVVNESVIGSTTDYVNAVEVAYRELWSMWCSN